MRFGRPEAIEVPEELWEPAMDEVTVAGGEVGLDYCTVDGVAVRRAPGPLGAEVQAIVHVAGSGDPRALTIEEG